MEEKQDIFLKHIKQKIWKDVFVITLLIYIVFCLFVYFIDGAISGTLFSKALAGTSAILFAASFSLSGFCYSWDSLDKKIGYRKYLGLMGFWTALAYSISLMLVDSQRYFYGFLDNALSADFILGIISMAIFTFMALISQDSIMKKMGPHNWRRALRLGYLAWLLLAIRAYVIEKELWAEYINTFDGFPPPRLLLTLLVIAVIIFRLSIVLAKCKKPWHNKK